MLGCFPPLRNALSETGCLNQNWSFKNLVRDVFTWCFKSTVEDPATVRFITIPIETIITTKLIFIVCTATTKKGRTMTIDLMVIVIKYHALVLDSSQCFTALTTTVL